MQPKLKWLPFHVDSVHSPFTQVIRQLQRFISNFGKNTPELMRFSEMTAEQSTLARELLSPLPVTGGFRHVVLSGGVHELIFPELVARSFCLQCVQKCLVLSEFQSFAEER